MNPACSLLLVDDDEEFLEILVRRFRRRGMSVVDAANPQAAINAAGQQNFHWRSSTDRCQGRTAWS